MKSDVITMPKSESFPNDTNNGVRLLAYAYAMSGKDSGAVSSKDGKAKDRFGNFGLINELEKTRLDA